MSLLSPLSRLVEKIISRQVMDYLETNGLLHPDIHSYRKEHGCATSLLEMYEEAVNAQEEGNYFALNLYDQSSAFDLVDFHIFLSELKLLEF